MSYFYGVLSYMTKTRFNVSSYFLHMPRPPCACAMPPAEESGAEHAGALAGFFRVATRDCGGAPHHLDQRKRRTRAASKREAGGARAPASAAPAPAPAPAVGTTRPESSWRLAGGGAVASSLRLSASPILRESQAEVQPRLYSAVSRRAALLRHVRMTWAWLGLGG